MTLIDTSGLLAALFPDQRQHQACAEALAAATRPFLLSPFVLAELDYLVAKLAGSEIALELLREVARGAYRLAPFTSADVEEVAVWIERYRDLEIGLADASIVVLAHRLGIRDLLTLDERHFRTLPGAAGRRFRLLPADLQ